MTVRSQFQTHLYTHADAVGFCAPITLMEYLTDLLADRLRDRDIMAQPSFAERYLSFIKARDLEIYENSEMTPCSSSASRQNGVVGEAWT
jgi:hypothetical protein